MKRRIQVDADLVKKAEKALTKFNENIIKLNNEKNSSGEFKKDLFLKGGYCYEKSDLGPGFVDKVFEDGKRITGKITNGAFVEVSDLNKSRRK